MDSIKYLYHRGIFIVNEEQLEEILELIDAVLFEKEGEKWNE